MNRERPLPPEVRALLDHEREIQPLPTTVRARAVARARAALLAGVDRRVVPVPARRPRWLAVAAMICIVSAGVGAAAYQVRAHLASPPEIRPLPAPVKIVAPPRPAPAAEALPEPEPAIAPAATASKPALSKAESARAELHLLRQARAAVARDDFAAALPPIAEHARRFKDGRLSEEREALRVKALAGLGRTDDARRAGAAFRARFPRSVLLSAVNKLSPPPGP
jgi:hypothetical protein